MDRKTNPTKTSEKQNVQQEQLAKDEIIEIITEVMDFQTVDTITSGWNTFKYVNKSKETHFFLLDKYPEGRTIEDTKRDIMPPFDKGMDLINQGNMDEAMAAFGELPEWFSTIVFSGGSGLVSPKHTSTTTVKLDSGYYIIECYVKMANGKFHTSMGMIKELVVLDRDSGHSPPKLTVQIELSSTEGIIYNGEISSGKQVFEVSFKDQIVHENFVGHDINLVRLEENADLEELEAWMNWATPTGLMTPAPEGVVFLGGTNDSPTGSTQYFEVKLEPGNYAFISEVPSSKKKGMFKTFKVTN
jgi:hypothetical protein